MCEGAPAPLIPAKFASCSTHSAGPVYPADSRVHQDVCRAVFWRFLFGVWERNPYDNDLRRLSHSHYFLKDLSAPGRLLPNCDACVAFAAKRRRPIWSRAVVRLGEDTRKKLRTNRRSTQMRVALPSLRVQTFTPPTEVFQTKSAAMLGSHTQLSEFGYVIRSVPFSRVALVSKTGSAHTISNLSLRLLVAKVQQKTRD